MRAGERRSKVDATIRPYALSAGQGPAFWGFGHLLTVKASGEQTGGALAVVEAAAAPGAATPYHVHHSEDEGFYVLEGELTFFSGDRRLQAGPGEYVWWPRGVPHGYRSTSATPTRFLILLTPAGFERFFIEMGQPALAPGLPPPDMPLDVEKLLAAAPRYAHEILGPLPE
jgi:quercetin dioxygenase-like cupin family protein